MILLKMTICENREFEAANVAIIIIHKIEIKICPFGIAQKTRKYNRFINNAN